MDRKIAYLRLGLASMYLLHFIEAMQAPIVSPSKRSAWRVSEDRTIREFANFAKTTEGDCRLRAWVCARRVGARNDRNQGPGNAAFSVVRLP